MDEVWKPFPKQEEALLSNSYETLFGGARGPGKTDTGEVWLLKPFSYDISPQSLARYRALVIRKNSNDLTDWLDRASYMYSRYGAKLGSEFNSPVIRFPQGPKIRTGHLKDSTAYTKYVGHEYQRQLIEELNQIKNETDYLKLISSCRSTVTGIDARVFATTNPGGIGHKWIKERFVDVSEWGVPFEYEEKVQDRVIRRSRIFIHSTIDDNPILMEKDPGYILTIEQLKDKDPETYKAWRFGDWNVFAGMFFREFTKALHICKPFMPSKNSDGTLKNVLVGGMDWGFNAPMSMHIAEVTKVRYNNVFFYRARTFIELYVTNKTPSQAADLFKEKLKDFGLTLKDISWIQADPATFNKGTDGSISIKDQFIKADEGYRKLKAGSNDRIPGWAIMHNWMSTAPDGLAYWQIAENCVNLISEIGSAIYDEHKIEDLEAEFDHSLDEQRYMLKALKWLDGGKAGAVVHPQPNQQYVQRTAQFIGTKQVGMDLDVWADVNASSSGVGAVVHK